MYLFLRNSRSMPQEVFFKKDKHHFRGTSLGDCFWNIWKCSPLLFGHFTISPGALLQRNSRGSLPDVFFKKGEHLLRRTQLGTAQGTYEIVLYYFLFVQFYSCPYFWQIYFKCFLHTVLLQSFQLILIWTSLFLFSLYFFCPRIFSMQV